MVEPKMQAAYLINNYVWQLLKNNTTMTEADYKDATAPSGRVPIVPANMEPTLAAINKPFLVYGFSEDTTADLYARRAGSLSYAIWSTSYSEILSIMNVIRSAMEKRDESAREVNNYSSQVAYSTFAGIRFGSIHVGYFESPTPEETEGGRQAGVITLRYDYFMDIAVKTFKNGAWA